MKNNTKTTAHGAGDGAADLTDEQWLELAACYAEYCGVDPKFRDDWRSEMVGAKHFFREIAKIWRRRKLSSKGDNSQ